MSVSPMMELDVRAFIAPFFSKNAVENGLRYVRLGRVSGAKVEYSDDSQDLNIRARVRGSAPAPYEVTVTVQVGDDVAIESECSCPVGMDCKHGVAALAQACYDDERILELADACDPEDLVPEIIRLSGRNPLAQKPRAAAPPKPAIDYPLEQWINALAEVRRAPAAKPRTEERALFLCVCADGPRAEGGVSAVLRHSKRLKSGQWNAGQEFSLRSNALAVIETLSERESRLLRILRGEHALAQSYDKSIQLCGRFGVEILKEALAAERLCYQGGGRLLSLGEARPARLTWKGLGNGQHLADVAVEPAATRVLPLDPPWYVDATTMTCGPIDCPVSSRMLEAWLASPPVMPGLDRPMAKRLAPLRLPPPPRVEITVRTDVPPVPVLRLWGRHLDGWSVPSKLARKLDGPLQIGVATLSFDYAGCRCFPRERAMFLEVFREGRLERIARHPELETPNIQALSALLVSTQDPKSQFKFYDPRFPEDANFILGTIEHPGDMQHGWTAFVQQAVPALEKRGWRIEYDDSFPYRFVQIQEWFSDAAPVEGNDWFDLELGVMVDGQRINLLPILSHVLRDMAAQEVAIEPKLNYAIRMFDGRMLHIEGARLILIREAFRELIDPDALLKNGKLRAAKLRAADTVNILGTSNARWLGSPALRELGTKIQQFDHVQPVAAPEGFTAQLRPYQSDGLAWLQFLREFDLAGILADDMGLGKTVQALAHLAEEKRSGRADRPSLVVAPTSLMANWRREAERFAPGLRVLVLHGTERKSHFSELPDADLVVTSYPLLPRDEEILIQQPFHMVILDEAQYIKNPKATWSQVATKLQARHRLAMTGTPMENHLGELWSIMNFLMPGYLGDERQFRRIFRTPIEKHQDAASRTSLQRRLRPFLLRRRKEQVAAELPPKTEILRTVDLEGAQRDLYETVRATMQEKVQQEIASKGLARSHIIILDALLKLRQVCCDPRLVKIDAARKVKESAKLELLMDLLPDLLAEGRRILLFSQFTSMLELIRARLDAAKTPYLLLTGETTDRDTPVQRFQNCEVPLFLISLKAGGTGLNLTAADTVIHYDPWWNPAVEMQATDRAHRIGQDKKVFVYKLTTAGTVEEKILALQEKKRQLLAGILGEETPVAKLSANDLTELFAPLG